MNAPAPDLIASASIVVDAPASTVFAILADPRQHSRIDGSGTVQKVATGPETLTLGSTFGMEMKRGMGYTSSNTVREFEQDSLIAWGNRGKHLWRYEIETVGEADEQKVRVTETWDGTQYTGFPKFLFSVLGLKGTQGSIEQTLVKLKDAAEADARG